MSGKAFITQPAPEWKATAVVDGAFKEVNLSDYKGKWLVMFFYPLDFTFVCPTEIVAFSEAAAQFEKIDTKIVGISVDSHFTHLAWINTPRNKGGLGEMKIPLVADLDKKIASDYGVLLPAGIALRGLFIIDPKQNIRQITINDLPVGRSVDEILRLVTAFQFVEEHGEVCPANWKPGAATIKPNPKDSHEFFSKQ
jgi:peroxiredoxin (alkyl hydroperoxide reductase subunit C)